MKKVLALSFGAAETELRVAPEVDGQPIPLSALTKAQASKVIDALLAAR